MTSTAIVEHLAQEFSSTADHVRATLDMIDAGLSAPYVGRVRRGETGGLSESFVRRLAHRRTELEELDRRRSTILRMLESTPDLPPSVLDRVRNCMDRFELEDLFVPHRRPEPEVQLAIDRGLGKLADALVAPVAGAEPAPEEVHDETGDDPAAEAPAVEPARSESEPAEGNHAAEEHGESEPADAGSSSEAEASAAEPAGALETVSSETGHDEEGHADSVSAGSGARRDAAAGAASPEAAEAALHAEIELTPSLARVCAPFVSPDKGVHTEMEALTGALRILSDRLGRNARLRSLVRRMLRKHGVLSVRALFEESRLGRHKSLLKLRQPLRQIQGHRLLAIRQAQKERAVAAVISLDRSVVLPKVRAALGTRTHPDFASVLDTVALRALERRLLPTVDADVRLELKERADEEALRFLTQHLRQVLFSPTFPRRPVAGVDINAKGDWTVAVLDENGNAAAPPARIEVGEKDAPTLATELVTALAGSGARAFAVGNGKPARTALPKLRAALAVAGEGRFATIVNEAGLASYANSELARTELAGTTVPQRMAISLGRRLQDPMWEILKVEPRHLGLGSEQGLVSKANVRRTFLETVESCVAHVGCDVNHAPVSFLQHVPGLDHATAKKIVEHRTTKAIESREELRNAGLLTEAQWTSAVAFLRVPESAERLDATSLHPEQYDLARRVLEATGGVPEETLGRPGATKGLRRVDFGVDDATWRDLMRELSFPGRDPRPRNFEPRLLEAATDPVTLTRDRVVEGVISSVMSFGAFVDLGLDREGLIHIREISDRYVRDAREALSIGQVVRTRILEAAGPRITLSLKGVPDHVREPRRPRFERGERGGEQRGEGRGPDRGDRRGRGPREHREPREEKPATPVRAAQTRRDGLVPGSRGGRGGRGDRPGGRGGPRREGGRDEGFSRDDLKQASKTPVRFTPFADFFKNKEDKV